MEVFPVISSSKIKARLPPYNEYSFIHVLGCGALFFMDLGLWAKDAWFRDWAQRLSQEYEYAAFSIQAFASVHDGMIKGGLRA